MFEHSRRTIYDKMGGITVFRNNQGDYFSVHASVNGRTFVNLGEFKDYLSESGFSPATLGKAEMLWTSGAKN